MSNMDNILSNEIILVGDIVSYYIEKNEEYDFQRRWIEKIYKRYPSIDELNILRRL